jgi:hypothetical protein
VADLDISFGIVPDWNALVRQIRNGDHEARQGDPGPVQGMNNSVLPSAFLKRMPARRA